jgi:hypothetical protein
MISVVTPCVSMFSAVASAAGEGWLWMLMKPGATYRPRTSSSSRAVARERLPIRAIRPSAIATSARYGSRPDPSTIVPCRRMTAK